MSSGQINVKQAEARWRAALRVLCACLFWLLLCHDGFAASPTNSIVELDGRGSYVELPTDLGADLDQMTVEFWVRWDRWNYFSTPLYFGDKTHAVVIGNRFGTDQLQAYIQPASPVPLIAEAGYLLATNQWCHVGLTLGTGELRLYYNGVCVATNATKATASSCLRGAPDRWLGRSAWTTSGFFRGAVDDFRLWSRALTPKQLWDAAHREVHSAERDLVAAWNFDKIQMDHGDAVSWSMGPRPLAARLRGHATSATAPTPRQRGIPAPGQFQLRIRGTDGLPIPARVYLWQGPHIQQKLAANETGLAAIQTPPSPRFSQAQITHGRFGVWTNLDLQMSSTAPLDLTLPTAPVIAGRVLAGDNSPQAGVHIEIDRIESTQDPGHLVSLLLTDADGRFEYVNPEPARHRIRLRGSVSALGEETRVQEERVVDVRPGAPVEEITFRVGRVSAMGRWSRVTQKDGGPSGHVTALAADSSGVLWAATATTLVRMDPGGARQWTGQEQLPAREITSLAQTDDGQLWVGTDSGLLGFSANRFVRWPGSPTGRCDQVTMGTDGAVWMGFDAELWRLKNGEWKSFGPTEGLPGGTIRMITKAAGYDVVLRADGGSAGVKKSVVESLDVYGSLAPDSFMEPVEIPTLLRSSHVGENERWFTFQKWFARYDGRDWSLLPMPIPGELVELWRRTQCVRGYDGKIWVGLGRAGLFRWDPRPSNSVTREDGLPDSHVTCSARDSAGRLWIGTAQGLIQWSPSGVVLYNETHGLPSKRITALETDTAGNLWIGTWGGLARTSGAGQNILPQPIAKPVLGIRQGKQTLWIATAGDGALQWNGTEFLNLGAKLGEYHPFAAAVLPMAELDGWFVSKGIFRVHADRLESVRIPPFIDQDLLSAMEDGGDGSAWVGTHAYGLFRLRNGELFPQAIDGTSGPPWILCLYRDRHRRLWCGTADGALCFDGELWSRLDTRDGLPGDSINQIRVEEDGSVWFATDKGLHRHVPGTVAPSVQIASVTSDRLHTNFLGGLSLQMGLPVTLLARTSLHPTPPRLRWRISVENEIGSGPWTALDPALEFQWVPQRKGHHIIEVMAVDRDLNRSRPARIEVTVVPHWASNPTVLVPLSLGGFLIFGILGNMVFQSRRQQREAANLRLEAQKREEEAAIRSSFARELIASQEAERKRIAHELHDSLGQELLLIRNAALLGSQREAADNPTLNDIASRASRAIDGVRQIAYALRPQELDKLGMSRALRALAEEVAELGSLELVFETEPLDGLLSPEGEISLFRAVQEALSNVLRHARADRLEIRFHRDGATLRGIIRDDGCGFDPASTGDREKPGLGLTGIEERLRLLGGSATLSSQPNQGTTLDLQIPCERGQST
jgi:signal transduction histidine kinase/ligand-binding sensor domain-containing protein